MSIQELVARHDTAIPKPRPYIPLFQPDNLDEYLSSYLIKTFPRELVSLIVPGHVDLSLRCAAGGPFPSATEIWGEL